MKTIATEEVAEVVRLSVASVEEEDMAEVSEAVSAEEALAVVQAVEAVPVHLAANRPDDDFLRTTPGLYPDLLDELECKDRFRVMPRQWRTLWVTVRIGEDCPAGTYPVKLLFSDIDWQGKWRPETVATAARDNEQPDGSAS